MTSSPVPALYSPCLMKIVFHLLILHLLASWCPAGDKIVTVGVYENAPKIFTDKDKAAGIFIDILEYIAQSEGWELHYRSGSWAENLDRLARGEIDLMPDMAYSAERGKLFSFPKIPALSSWFQVYAPKGHDIRSILDLNGKRILILDRSIQQEAFSRLSKGFGLRCTLVNVPDYNTMFEQVREGKGDVAVTNSFYGMTHARQFDLEDTAILFEPSDLFYVASKNDPKLLLGAIDRHLTELKEDSESVYYSSLRQWTSDKVRFRLPLWLKMTGAAVMGVLVLSLIGSVVLKQQVNERTRELRQINQEMEERISARTAELAAINQEQHSIFASAGVGIVVLRDRVIERCNRKMEELTGYGPGELLGMSTRAWYPDEKAFEVGGRQVYAQMARGETHCRSQQLARKDGTLFWARLSLRAFDENDPLKGAVGIIEDITEEREAAESLRRAMERAQDADRIKSAFLATMSHELRTPLNSIIGFTGIMLQGLTGPLNEEQQKQMSMVQNSSRHLLSLINDVLDISKIEAGQLDLAQAPFALKPSIEKVIKMVSPLAMQKGLELWMEVAEDVGSVITDQRRFEQILLNLVNNAVKFTEQGQVGVACRLEKNQYLVSVADTGIGMPAEELGRIFQPFHQVDAGLARRHEGTGLGLSICKKLLDLMGGSIEVRSQQGAGSKFVIRLPRQAGGVV
jgi:PAS domain S-box-containing protein